MITRCPYCGMRTDDLAGHLKRAMPSRRLVIVSNQAWSEPKQSLLPDQEIEGLGLWVSPPRKDSR